MTGVVAAAESTSARTVVTSGPGELTTTVPARSSGRSAERAVITPKPALTVEDQTASLSAAGAAEGVDVLTNTASAV
jgi:hypothetical protein